MKRIFSFLVIFIFAFFIFVVPVSAAVVNDESGKYSYFVPDDHSERSKFLMYEVTTPFTWGPSSYDIGDVLLLYCSSDFSNGSSLYRFDSESSALQFLKIGSSNSPYSTVYITSSYLDACCHFLAGNASGYQKYPLYAMTVVDKFEVFEINRSLDEIISILPVLLPCLCGFISLRKAIDFVRGVISCA